MTSHTWWLFVATAFVVSGIPGPNMLLVMTHSARHGLRRATVTMAGCLSALIIMLSISAAGLGVFLQAWPTMFDALRLIGAAYLVYLGVKSWRAAPAEPSPERSFNPSFNQSDAAPVARAGGRGGALYRTGFLVASSNPKAILFAAALLPQFIDAAQPTLPQFGVLVATFAVIEVSWYVAYAAFGVRIGATLRSERVAKAFNRLTGGVFVGFGAMMALVRH